MRPGLILVATLLLGAAAWWAVSGTEAPAAPAIVIETSEQDAALPTPDHLSAERNPIANQPNTPPQPSTDAEPPTAPAAGDDASPPAGRLTIEARGPDDQPLTGFRYVLQRAGQVVEAAQVDGHRHELHLALDEVRTLIVEAPGYEPSEPTPIRLTSAEPSFHAYFYLTPAAPGTGIELLVFAPGQVAVKQIEVTAWETTDAADQLLWRRRARDAGGRYMLPDLNPDRSYRLRVCAADEDGRLAPLLAFEETVTLAGRPVLMVDLTPGCFFRVTATDPAGQVLGQEVALQLLYPDRGPVPTTWQAAVNGEHLERVDGLPAAAVARLAAPIPAGTYTLQARVGDGAVTEHRVDLTVGLEPEVRLVLAR